MSVGPGKYDDLCTSIREETNAAGAAFHLSDDGAGGLSDHDGVHGEIMTTDNNDAIVFVREIVSNQCWNLAYHEALLPEAYQKRDLALELLKRLNLTAEQIATVESDYDEDTDLETIGTVEQLMAAMYRDC